MKKKRKGSGKHKGGNYERELCTTLSKWWTQSLQEPREDIFWRSHGSGARAKTRGRKQKDTMGQAGDICATDPIGQPLIDLITIEAKKGYNKDTIGNLLDKPKDAAKQTYEMWFEQAIESHQQAGSYSWMLIHKRDRREAMVFMPLSLSSDLFSDHVVSFVTVPILKKEVCIACVTLNLFLRDVSPEHIKALAKRV